MVTRREVAQFLRFAAVGAVGFALDDGVLLICIHAFRLDPVESRFVSFAVAVACTFQLNRAWAFSGRADPGFARGLALYLGVQGFGFCCNLGIFASLVLMAPPPLNDPTLCLAAASAAALVVNYLGSRTVVFCGRRS